MTIANPSASNFTAYALLGSGRVARHLRFYLEDLRLPVLTWSRDGAAPFNSFTSGDPTARLSQVLARASHVLIAVRDEAIADLAAGLAPNQIGVHFSGALTVDGAHAAHPLMTFGGRLEDPSWYRRIPFVLDRGSPDFTALLPGLPNPHFAVAPGLRPYYHALCAVAGNSTFLLLQQAGDEFEKTLGLPRALLTPFLHQVVDNAARDEGADFTGPVARGDWKVVAGHLESLRGRNDRLLQVYRQYLNAAAQAGHPVPETWL